MRFLDAISRHSDGSHQGLLEGAETEVTRNATEDEPAFLIEAIGDVLVTFAESHKSAVAMFVRELLDSPAAGEENIGDFVAIVEMIESFIARDASHLVPDPFHTYHLVTNRTLDNLLVITLSLRTSPYRLK